MYQSPTSGYGSKPCEQVCNDNHLGNSPGNQRIPVRGEIAEGPITTPLIVR
jgi:hypothetical protein